MQGSLLSIIEVLTLQYEYHRGIMGSLSVVSGLFNQLVTYFQVTNTRQAHLTVLPLKLHRWVYRCTD